MYAYSVFCSLLAFTPHLTDAFPHSTEKVRDIDQRDSVSLPVGISSEEASEAFPPRDAANIANWFGTSLYGWDGCNELSPNVKDAIKEAYVDANKLANQDGLKDNINWDSVAAFEFLGPSALNKDQQSQIQAVLANLATVKDGSSLWTPNWIRARCDDPLLRCGCLTDGPDPRTTAAYARNPGNNGNNNPDPDISFCPSFFTQMNLDNAVLRGSTTSRPHNKYDVEFWESRASTFLHELLHLDLAADSVNQSPNPHIRDIRIRFVADNGERIGYITAYGATYSKIVARFNSGRATIKPTGYFVQRNVDNYVGFVLANYVKSIINDYPWLPVIYDKISNAPLIPRDRTSINSIVYSVNGDGPAIFNTTGGKFADSSGPSAAGNVCSLVPSRDIDGADKFNVGASYDATMMPVDYANERFKFLSSLGGTDNPFSAVPSCSMDIEEIWTCEDAAQNLYASVSIKSPSGYPHYQTLQSAHTPGQSINDGSSLSIRNDTMQHDMIITGEHQNDYIQFNFGDLAWKSDTTDGAATCKMNGDNWDPKGPQGCPTKALTRSFTCNFPCDGKATR